MEKPSLEEVIKYFNNAAVIKSVYNTNGVYSDKNIHIDNEAYFCETENKVCLAIWHKKYGYAKILTYKNTEPKFEITKEQLMQLENGFTLPKLQEWFPEVFENKKHFGKWYNHAAGGIWKIDSEPDGKGNCYVYGFRRDYKYFEREINNIERLKHECDSEKVTEALKNEAVKRGIKLGGYIVRDFDDNLKNVVINDESFPNDATWFYDHGRDYLEYCGFVVYSKGQWASVIETKTIQEAEELLKELGHNFKIV